jgi:hypothetical protein
VPLSDNQNGEAALNGTPQGFAKSGSVVFAIPWMIVRPPQLSKNSAFYGRQELSQTTTPDRIFQLGLASPE